MGIRDKINAAKAEEEAQTHAETQTAARPPYTYSNGTGPFDKLADLASWADILEPANWKKVPAGDAATEEATPRRDPSDKRQSP